MLIRRYEEKDCNEVLDLFLDTVRSVNIKDYSSKQIAAWTSGKEDKKLWNESLLKHYAVVAIVDGAIVGFGDIDLTGYLDRLYVHKDYLKKGIGAAICDELEKQISGLKIGVQAAITAKPFFEKRGYQVIKEQKVKRQGCFLTNFVMEKKL